MEAEVGRLTTETMTVCKEHDMLMSGTRNKRLLLCCCCVSSVKWDMVGIVGRDNMVFCVPLDGRDGNKICISTLEFFIYSTLCRPDSVVARREYNGNPGKSSIHYHVHETTLNANKTTGRAALRFVLGLEFGDSAGAVQWGNSIIVEAPASMVPKRIREEYYKNGEEVFTI